MKNRTNRPVRTPQLKVDPFEMVSGADKLQYFSLDFFLYEKLLPQYAYSLRQYLNYSEKYTVQTLQVVLESSNCDILLRFLQQLASPTTHFQTLSIDLQPFRLQKQSISLGTSE